MAPYIGRWNEHEPLDQTDLSDIIDWTSKMVREPTLKATTRWTQPGSADQEVGSTNPTHF
jgi:hypothetical protein